MVHGKGVYHGEGLQRMKRVNRDVKVMDTLPGESSGGWEGMAPNPRQIIVLFVASVCSLCLNEA